MRLELHSSNKKVGKAWNLHWDIVENEILKWQLFIFIVIVNMQPEIEFEISLKLKFSSGDY